MVSGSFSLLCSRFFSPFLHSTGSLSVSREYLALALLRNLPDTILDVAYRVITVSDRLFQIVRLSEPHLYGNPSTPTMPKHRRFGLFRFRSPLLTESLLFSFPVGNEMFQFPTFASRIPGMTGCPAGLPHSEICGSRDICSSPQLFAAYHVLLRLREPRHPPYALIYFLRLRPSLF